MEEKSGRKEKMKSGNEKRELLFVLLFLFICVALTSILLAERLSALAASESNIIALAPSEEKIEAIEASGTLTKKSNYSKSETVRAAAASTRMDGQSEISQGEAPEYQAGDGTGTWTTDTRVDLFRVQYENDQKVVTVCGNDGDEVIAPGTENDYTFWLKNTSNGTADYEMSVEAYMTSGEAEIPVKARMKNDGGDYLLGSEEQWDEVLALNGVSDKATLGANRYARYTLEWQWPFESGDDESDTALGNQTEGKDIALTVVIKTVTSANTDLDLSEGLSQPGRLGVLPKTGDETHIMFYLLLLAGSGTLIVIMLVKRRREKASR